MIRRPRPGLVPAVLRVTAGNLLEQYDFFVFAFYATDIGHAFFPGRSAFAAVTLSLATFGAGFLMRPLGAIVLGSYVDRHGRRAGLLLTLALMGLGTATLALTPTASAIGLAAPLIVLAGRLVQGFSAGAELGGVSVYLLEIAPPGREGLLCAFQSASQQLAVIAVASLGAILGALLTRHAMADWGWRIPFAIGCAVLPLLLWLRRSLAETDAFLAAAANRDGNAGTRSSLAVLWPLVLAGCGAVALTTTSFYFITAYTPTFGRLALGLRPDAVLLVAVAVGVSNFLWLPIGGALFDRFGPWPMLPLVPLAVIATAVPALDWLVEAPGIDRLFAVLMLLSAYFGLYNGALIPTLAQLMPVANRTGGFSLAYSLATAVFGGFTPAIATLLIHLTADRASPGWWLTAVAAISLASVLAFRRSTRRTGAHDQSGASTCT